MGQGRDGQAGGQNLDWGVAYQPNPFVNPNQRGVELPPGCKDLMDVLKMQPVAEGWFDGEKWTAKWRTKRKGEGVATGGGSGKSEYGCLGVLETQVTRYLATASERKFFSVFALPQRVMVSVFHEGAEASLKLNVKPAQAAVREVVRRILQRPELFQNEKEFVSVPVANSAPEIARVLRELLVDAYGIKEDERLMFYSFFRSGDARTE